MKKLITFLGVLFSFFSVFSQQVQVPAISVETGFYENAFSVTITHSNPNALIIYTLDGSVPHLDNIGGVIYNYKNSYAENPNDEMGELLQNSFETLEYISPIEVVDRSNEPNKIAGISTTFQNNPQLPDSPVFKATVLRARAIVNSQYSDVVTKNYFVTPLGVNRYTLPIITLNIDDDKYYSYEYGLNVAGLGFDQWRSNNPDEIAGQWSGSNYWASGSESELQLNFGYIENGVEVLNHDVGIRNHGNGSRYMPNRSVRLYAKAGYGESRFNHSFFNNYNYDSFKRIILRNSGNDASKTMFRDAFIQQLTKHLNFETQEYQPIILFVNSEYCGIYNMRERFDEHYFDRVFDLDEDDIDFLENSGAGDGVVDLGDDIHYQSMINYLENNSLEDDSNYEYVTTLIDIENYTDYYITYIFSGNYDWPHNNNEYWRKRVPYSANAVHGHDGRWRWVVKDMDYGYNLWNWADGNTHNTLDFSTKLYEDSEASAAYFNKSTLIMRRLLENENYRNYFINRFADLINTTFSSSRGVDFIDEMASVIEPEIEEHIMRWNMITSVTEWQNNVEIMRNFVRLRPTIQRNHIRQKFNIYQNLQVVVNVSDENYGYIKLNTIDILNSTAGIPENPYPWTGTYFHNIPIKITAIPNEGYAFSHWEGTENGQESELLVMPQAGIYAKAIFVQEGANNEDYKESFEVKIYPNPFEDMIYLLSEEYGFEYSIFTIDGKLVKKGVKNSSTLYLDELTKGIYLLKLKTKEKEEIHKIIKK